MYRMPWESRVEMLCEELLAAENNTFVLEDSLICSFKGTWPTADYVKKMCTLISNAEDKEWAARLAYYRLYLE